MEANTTASSLDRNVVTTLLGQPEQLPDWLRATDKAALHAYAEDLARRVSEADAADVRREIFAFLDLVRYPAVQKQFKTLEQQNAWLEILLRLITAADFTVGQVFLQRAERYPEKTLFRVLRHPTQEVTFARAREQVFAYARALLSCVSPNPNRCQVAILSTNRLEMVYLDLACLLTGLVDVLIPANAVEGQIEYMLRRTEVELLFVADESLLARVLSRRGNLPGLKRIVLLEDSPTAGLPSGVETLSRFLEANQGVSEQAVLAAADAVKVGDRATVMFTSGTTDTPKGIQFSHLNLVSKRFARALALPDLGDGDVFLCYLPLFHTFGRFFEMLGCVFWGAEYVFVESPKIDTLLRNFKQARPTVFISIPQKWMQLYEKLQERVDVRTAPTERIQAAVAEMTGGRLKWGLSAAGYLDPDIFRFFQHTGVELMSGFGMTEATGGITMTPPFRYKRNSVGKALPGIEIRLARDGEMWIRGPYVMPGYLERTGKRRKDGWLPTGDIFSRDEEGYFWILDRKKDIYKNTRGETIAPQKIENLFLEFDTVAQAFLVGDHRPYNMLLLYPNYDYDQVDLKALSHEQLREFYKSHIVWVNRFLAPYERVVNFAVLPRPFDPGKGELTPKGTFKRKVVEANFRDLIDQLYQKDYVVHVVNGLEVRIPHWFLREIGLTADDLHARGKRLAAGTRETQLRIERARHDKHKVRVGSFWYTSQQDHVDLGQLLVTPELWLGNAEVLEFVGEQIFAWQRPQSAGRSGLNLLKLTRSPRPATALLRKFAQAARREASLQGLHYAAVILQSGQYHLAEKALDYVVTVLEAEEDLLRRSATAILERTARFASLKLRTLAFQQLLKHAQSVGIHYVLNTLLESEPPVLDRTTIEAICDLDLTHEQLQAILKSLDEQLANPQAAQKRSKSLMNLLTAYGTSHPTRYKLIRAGLVKWRCRDCHHGLRQYASRCLQRLQKSFREWLGPNQKLAVDAETGREYRWEDVTTFEQEISPDHVRLMLTALQRDPILREAVFLFSGGTLVRLQDIAVKGVWISLLGQQDGRSRYRVSVQTRFFGAFDFTLNLNESVEEGRLTDEIDWLMTAYQPDGRLPLVKDFGGYWPQYGIWTEEYISGQTIGKVLRRLDRHDDEEARQRMRLTWLNFAWSAVAAYVDFWARTDRRYYLDHPMSENVIAPSYDYQVGYRILSISQKRPVRDALTLLLWLWQEGIAAVEARFEKLKGVCDWSVIFAAFLEVLGENEGFAFLERTLLFAETQKQRPPLANLTRALRRYLDEVRQRAFSPRRLHFAVQRYHRWLELNPGATPQAQMQTLRDLYDTYALANLEQRYPGVRIQFFRDTVFSRAEDQVARSLDAIVRQIREHRLSDREILELLNDLRKQVKRVPHAEFYLTRMTFPHLSPADTAELISLPSEGTQKADVVVFMEDQEGNMLSIRNPASPKEIGRLHRLFVIAKLPVEFAAEHQYLVVLNDRQEVVGGLFYRPTGKDQVHLEKIVVDENHRRKGVSEGLLKEFFNRLRGQGVRIVTVGFLRPQFFYRFGFTLDRQFGNLVKRLEPAASAQSEKAALPSL